MTTTQDLDTGLYTSEEFERRLTEELKHAARDGRPYAVLACVPQHLPGEGVADVVEAATASVRSLVRKSDLAGRLGDEILAIGLPGTTATGARALAHRLQGDLGLRSNHLRNTVWEAGFACLPEDGLTTLALLPAAVEAARTRRLRLAP